MDSKQLFGIFLLAMLLLFGISFVFGMAAAGIAAFRERKRRIAARAKAAASYPADGVVLDTQLVQDSPVMPSLLHYKYSIRYTDTAGALHRALIGITTGTPLHYAPGEAIPLHIFQQSVIVPDAEAFNPQRCATGRIDCPISFRKWLDKPIDETGTVMLAHDYQALSDDLEKKIRSLQTAGWLWLTGSGIGLILCICAGIALVLEF
ncbi:MAG: hypothetical protein J6S92_05685 [Oscillospiraceae bacterium]|nr:hypothetical protein [Oscillospiraceae bacterium]MBQ5340175.1 hypothetical protein [Oscillospiraceae bacterium]